MLRQSVRRIQLGVVWFVGGAAITVMTFIYRKILGIVIAGDGVVLFGLVTMLRGLVGWMKYRS